MVVVGKRAALLEVASLLRQLVADLVVLGMFDYRLGDVFVAEVDCRQQRLVDLPAVHVIQQESHRLRRCNTLSAYFLVYYTT